MAKPIIDAEVAPTTMTHAEWKQEGMRRFGADQMAWKFICPSCGHVASSQDWKDAGAPEGAVAFSCVGRYTLSRNDAESSAFKRAGGPCNYTGGGLIKLNPITIVFPDGGTRLCFAFAPVGVMQ